MIRKIIDSIWVPFFIGCGVYIISSAANQSGVLVKSAGLFIGLVYIWFAITDLRQEFKEHTRSEITRRKYSKVG